MGAWGTGNFENDKAMDWLAQLAGNGIEWVRTALALNNPGTNDCCAALAASEVVAACVGRPMSAAPKALLQWTKKNGRLITQSDVSMAIAAVVQIERDSKLQELFDEAGRDEGWHGVVLDLLTRLGGGAKDGGG